MTKNDGKNRGPEWYIKTRTVNKKWSTPGLKKFKISFFMWEEYPKYAEGIVKNWIRQASGNVKEGDLNIIVQEVD
mgnify:CR=1 FL=1